ncbi:MAG: hypothetical protein WBO91_00115, partial [Saprospiraceae bacterium]
FDTAYYSPHFQFSIFNFQFSILHFQLPHFFRRIITSLPHKSYQPSAINQPIFDTAYSSPHFQFLIFNSPFSISNYHISFEE